MLHSIDSLIGSPISCGCNFVVWEILSVVAWSLSPFVSAVLLCAVLACAGHIVVVALYICCLLYTASTHHK